MPSYFARTIFSENTLYTRSAGHSMAVALAVCGTVLAQSAHAETPAVHLFEVVEGNADFLESYLPEDVIQTVTNGTPAPGLDFTVLFVKPDLRLGQEWAIAQLITDQPCNARGECEIHVHQSSPVGWVTVAEVLAVHVSWLNDGNTSSSLIFSGLQGPAIWRWDWVAYVFDQIGDDDIADAYYAATGGDNR